MKERQGKTTLTKLFQLTDIRMVFPSNLGITEVI